MTNIEKTLDDKRKELEELEVPDELELRLKESLANISTKKRRTNIKTKVAALIIVVLLIGYNADTLAYYGKRLIGYDNVMNGTLQELNELEKGQIIDKSYTFENGSKVTLDGIMLDDNNLVVFYSIYDPKGNVDDVFSDLGVINIKGFGTTYYGGGQGQTSEDGKEMKWILTYDSPRFYEKNMKMKLRYRTTGEEGEIRFTLDRNKAMGNSLKIKIGEKIKVPGRKIEIKSLIASPITTIVKGEIQNILELGLDEIKGERIMTETIDLELLANGEKVNTQGSGISTDMKGSYFDITFDALPKDTKEIQIKLKSFGASEEVNEKIPLDKGDINKTIDILDQDIRINKIYEEHGNTYINITTQENVALTDVYLKIDGKETNQEQVIEGDYEKKVEGKEDVKIMRTRTIEFKGTGEKLELYINKIRYQKDYDKIIYSYEVE